MSAQSKLNPRLFGKIIKWIDADQFIVNVDGREILAHRKYWNIEKEN